MLSLGIKNAKQEKLQETANLRR